MGAWHELKDFVLGVDPDSLGELLAAMRRAIDMPTAERARRLAGTKRRVRARDNHDWWRDQLADIARKSATEGAAEPRSPPHGLRVHLLAPTLLVTALAAALDGSTGPHIALTVTGALLTMATAAAVVWGAATVARFLRQVLSRRSASRASRKPPRGPGTAGTDSMAAWGVNGALAGLMLGGWATGTLAAHGAAAAMIFSVRGGARAVLGGVQLPGRPLNARGRRDAVRLKDVDPRSTVLARNGLRRWWARLRSSEELPPGVRVLIVQTGPLPGGVIAVAEHGGTVRLSGDLTELLSGEELAALLAPVFAHIGDPSASGKSISRRHPLPDLSPVIAERVLRMLDASPRGRSRRYLARRLGVSRARLARVIADLTWL
ncbi:MAG: hypothetical protein ACRDQ1_21325, partial [Sciscionella sp.]